MKKPSWSWLAVWPNTLCEFQRHDGEGPNSAEVWNFLVLNWKKWAAIVHSKFDAPAKVLLDAFCVCVFFFRVLQVKISVSRSFLCVCKTGRRKKHTPICFKRIWSKLCCVGLTRSQMNSAFQIYFSWKVPFGGFFFLFNTKLFPWRTTSMCCEH